MENTIKRLIALMMIFIMSFSVITCVSSNDFTVSAASAKTISIKKKPTVKASKIKATTVKLSWSKTKGATSYRVYKSTDKKKWTLVTKTKKTSYTVKKLNGNKKYYFRVKAYKTTNSKTTKSPYSKVLTVKTKKNETVYAKETVNIRKGPDTSYGSIGTLAKGKSVTRTAIGDNGWSKISYNGGTYYVSSSYLTTTKPEVPTTKPTTTKPTTTKPATTKPTTTEPVITEPTTTEEYIMPSQTIDPEVCSYCGDKDCFPVIHDYHCVICKKTIPALSCHPYSHMDKSLD